MLLASCEGKPLGQSKPVFFALQWASDFRSPWEAADSVAELPHTSEKGVMRNQVLIRTQSRTSYR
jgi:hypothetical protein